MMSTDRSRRTTLITGASGGMGRACARSFGATTDLVLTDIAAGPLAEFAETLTREGYTVSAAIAADLAAGIAAEMLDTVARGPGLGAVIHTAGLSPAQADWQTIMRVNLVATETLLQAVEPILQPGTVAILMSSAAGHLSATTSETESVLADSLGPEFLPRLEPIIAAMAESDDPKAKSFISYGLSKRAVIATCEARAAAWGTRGARILSISPGTIRTPMGEREARENSDVAGIVAATPAGRWGTVMDIVAAARFLASDEAGFITGCDLQIDGGVVAAFLVATQQAQPAVIAQGSVLLVREA